MFAMLTSHRKSHSDHSDLADRTQDEFFHGYTSFSFLEDELHRPLKLLMNSTLHLLDQIEGLESLSQHDRGNVFSLLRLLVTILLGDLSEFHLLPVPSSLKHRS